MAKAVLPSQKDPKATSPIILKEDQLSNLLTTSKILHLLHHRNSNQHRRSHWYKSFSIFRRHLKHLLHDLTVSTNLPSTMLPSRKREIIKFCEEKLSNRLKMWKDVYVRKWFGDFSQLMADSQFAVIALVLLASLGRVCLITGVTEAIEEEEERDDSIGAALKGFAEREVGKEVDWLVGTIEDREMEDDVGVVIARDDQDEDEGETVEQAGAIDPVRVETDTSAIPEEVSSLIQPPKPKPKKRKSRSSPTTSAAETPNPRKAKKKKLKKRDAIDDLFGNLL